MLVSKSNARCYIAFPKIQDLTERLALIRSGLSRVKGRELSLKNMGSRMCAKSSWNLKRLLPLW